MKAKRDNRRTQPGPHAAPSPHRPKGVTVARITGLALATLYALLWIARLTRASVPAPNHPILLGNEPQLFAHRGASNQQQEHSSAAFSAALRQGADFLELDLWRSVDDQLIVSHDDNLKRVYNIDQTISTSTLSQLRGAIRDKVPSDPEALLLTLDDVVQHFPGTKLNIELKSSDPATISILLEKITTFEVWDRVLIASFDASALAQVRQRSHDRLATSAGSADVVWFLLCHWLDIPAQPEYVALQVPPRWGMNSRKFIDYAHRHNVRVHYWTVDNPATITELLALGADGIMTNNVIAARDVLSAFERSRSSTSQR